jgi:hypothetical protein
MQVANACYANNPTNSWTVGSAPTNYTGLDAPETWFQAVPSWSDIVSTAYSYRPVSGGVKVQYRANLLNASGMIATAPLPADTGVVRLGDETTGSITFDWVAQLADAFVTPAVDGCVSRLRPRLTTPKFRPLKNVVNVFTAIQDPNNDSWTGASGMTQYGLKPSVPCDVDPDVYNSYWVPASMVLGATAGNYWPFQTAAGAFIQPNMDHAGPANLTLQSYQSMLGWLQASMTSEATDSIILFATGLPPDTKVFQIDCVLNVELIADTRSFAGTFLKRPNLQASDEHAAKVMGRAIPSATRLENNAHPAEEQLEMPQPHDMDQLVRNGKALTEEEAEPAPGEVTNFIDSIGPVADELGSTVVDMLPELAAGLLAI